MCMGIAPDIRLCTTCVPGATGGRGWHGTPWYCSYRGLVRSCQMGARNLTEAPRRATCALNC